MSGELVTAAQIIAASGAGTWLADRLFGPSADALGEQLRAYVGSRITKIFSSAERKVKASNADTLPPGFALQFLQKASFSEDDELITELWASLLADAAEGFSNKHSVFVDILSQIGAEEARFLELAYLIDGEYPLLQRGDMGVRSDLFETIKRSVDWSGFPTEKEANDVVETLLTSEFPWPLLPCSAQSYWSRDRHTGKTGVVKRMVRDPNSFVANALIRQRLIEYFELDFTPGWASPRLDGFLITSLGIEFLDSCRKPNITSEDVEVDT